MCWQVLREMDDSDNITLASMEAYMAMHSINKGFYGRCDRRGGYLELMNVDADVVSEFYELASINLCSNLNGQICMALVMNPPKVTSILTSVTGSGCLSILAIGLLCSCGCQSSIRVSDMGHMCLGVA